MSTLPLQARFRSFVRVSSGPVSARLSLVLLCVLVIAFAQRSEAAHASPANEQSTRVLLLTKSSGFEHGVIKRAEGQSSHVEKVMSKLSQEQGFELTATKDASLITAESLQNYDVVIFYTTGNLTETGSGSGLFGGDGEAPMPKNGLSHLIQWVEKGGGFMGFHCASDTFKSSDLGLAKDEVTPYVALVGAEFKSHGAQFVGTLKLKDKDHPAIGKLPMTWNIKDEWYVFNHLNRERMHVIATLDPGEQRTLQKKIYDIPDYPVIWSQSVGGGRVFYNAMGHRSEVWDDPIFQDHVAAAIRWSAGAGETDSSPNYKDVIKP